MNRCFRKIKEPAGYTIIEATVVISVMLFIITAAYGLLDVAYLSDQQAEDGFQAQSEGRQVLTELGKHMRPAENMNLPTMPFILYATRDGKSLDVTVDTNNDNKAEIVRFELDTVNEQIKMYTDTKETTGAQAGKYNYEIAAQTYLAYYNPTNAADWDSVTVLANKIVNVPGGTSTTEWQIQTAATNPENDFRLFTFYGDSFALPLDTRDASPGLGAKWVNYVRGVKIFLLSDIQPAEIPSPFGIQTNIHLRNISGG